MKKVLLFPSCVFLSSIDSSLFNKQQLIDDMLFNYEKCESLNNWDTKSITHHTYNTFEEEYVRRRMRVISGSKYGLTDVYDKKVKEAIDQLHFQHDVSYQWFEANFTINTEFMQEHDHHTVIHTPQQQGVVTYSFIHYVSFDPSTHGSTLFSNPATIAAYGNLRPITNMMNSQDTDNSVYFADWILDTRENDIVFFPSFLKHSVHSKINPTYPRITVSGNILFHTQ